MEIFPAIDLQNGQCVRLKQGDFNAATIYDSEPLRVAQKFTDAGAHWLHVVDLDGARDGQSRQLDVITSLVQGAKLKLQVGGGIRTPEIIDLLIKAGVARVVIGSIAVKDPRAVKGWLKRFGAEKLVLAFDVRLDDKGQPEVLTQGWQQGSQLSLWQLLDLYAGSGLKTVLCTDVGRDGMLTGTNHDLYSAIGQRYPALDLLASGGVSDIHDLQALAQTGIYGAIVGKAIYEGRIDLADALRKITQVGGKRNAG
jgi:phosphoribosylformimino-5-aminoimidazole carboxamide ribotide isomerase